MIYVLCIVIVSVYLYTILHECLHGFVAYIFSMKLIYVQAFNLRYFFQNNSIKFSKKFLFNGDAGSCLALPKWDTTKRQWIIFIITPLLFTILLVAGALYINKLYIDATYFNVLCFLGVLYCILSIIPIKGTDGYYLWMYLFRKEEFETFLQVMVLCYAQIFSDDCNKKYHIESLAYWRNIKDNKIKQDYLEMILQIQSLRLYKNGKENSISLPNIIENEAKAAYINGSVEYKSIYLFYQYIKGEDNNKIINEYQQFQRELDSSKVWAACFLHILLGKKKDLNELEYSIKCEKSKYEKYGVVNSYHDTEKMYLDKAKFLLSSRANRE